MSLRSLTAAELLPQLGAFDAIIDARSPAEYAEDHLPGAQNWAVLDDDERREVGTAHAKLSPFDARKAGAARVAARIAELLARHVQDKPREWRPLVYCWRGGKRSGTLAWFLDQIGFQTTLLQGGYKAYRAAVREELLTLPGRLRYIVIAGRTGSGKTRLLAALASAGAQVLDLEGLAQHRGSVLGGPPTGEQPSQRAFETALWQRLRSFDAARPVYVESESRKIGRLQLPTSLLDRMRSDSPVVMVSMPDAARIDLLLEDYGFFSGQTDRFCLHLESLVDLRGRATVNEWQAWARAGHWRAVFAALMAQHYDPLYLGSIQRNYRCAAAAWPCDLQDGGAESLAQAADALLRLRTGSLREALPSNL